MLNVFELDLLLSIFICLKKIFKKKKNKLMKGINVIQQVLLGQLGGGMKQAYGYSEL